MISSQLSALVVRLTDKISSCLSEQRYAGTFFNTKPESPGGRLPHLPVSKVDSPTREIFDHDDCPASGRLP